MKIRNFRKIKPFGLAIFLWWFTLGFTPGFTANLTTDLEQAIRANKIGKVSEILKNGGSQLKQDLKISASYYLQLSARFGSSDLLEYMIKQCDFSQDKRALSEALISCIDNEHFASIAPILIGFGADPAFEFSDMTALGRLATLYAGKKEISPRTVKTARLLLDKGAYVDRFDDSMKTPLMTASERDDEALVALFLEYGANPALTNKDRQSAISLARPGSKVAEAFAKKSQTGSGLSLLDTPFKESSPNEGALLFDGPKGLFGEPGKSIDSDTVSQQKMQLSQAVAFGDLDGAKGILAKGISANSTIDNSGMTLLMQASSAKMVKLLLENGADARKIDANGWNALHFAATRESEIAIVGLLIKAGASVNARNKAGETPLRLAGILFTEKIAPDWGKNLIPLLYSNGADIDALDNEGQTLLHQAAFNNNGELARICVTLGANPDLKTFAGKTPREVGMELGSFKFLRALEGK